MTHGVCSRASALIASATSSDPRGARELLPADPPERVGQDGPRTATVLADLGIDPPA